MKKEFLLIIFCLPFISMAQSIVFKKKNISYLNKDLKNTTLLSVRSIPSSTIKSGQFKALDSMSVTFSYNGHMVTYGIIISPKTGRKWLDRNLGATQVAVNLTDSLAYGDLYEWGRMADGHQLRNSGTTFTMSSTIEPGHNNYIVSLSSQHDWLSPQNDSLWQGSIGKNNPCPKGWRLPTKSEFDAEAINNPNEAYIQLKLVFAGYRSRLFGNLGAVDEQGYYWTSTPSSPKSASFIVYSSFTGISNTDRGLGCSVRCIKN